MEYCHPFILQTAVTAIFLQMPSSLLCVKVLVEQSELPQQVSRLQCGGHSEATAYDG